jgi:hypothetical protein
MCEWVGFPSAPASCCVQAPKGDLSRVSRFRKVKWKIGAVDDISVDSLPKGFMVC